MNNDIDAVVTWVDGSDPKVAESLKNNIQSGRENTLTRLPAGISVNRHKNNGEIEYCIKGIRKMMPWIRNIFLVTSGQVPDFLDSKTLLELNVSLVDHKTIFMGYEWALPTFNSRAIENMLYRIPGISERYIYFNDDFITINPSLPEDFFVGQKVVLRGKWESFQHYGKLKTLFSSVALKSISYFSKRKASAHLLAQMRAAELAGFKNHYFHCSHSPHPVTTETLRAFFEKNPQILAENIKYKFRDINQFVAHPLAHHLEASHGNYVVQEGVDSITVNFAKPHEVDDALDLMQSSNVKFVCLQELDLARIDTRRSVICFLRQRLGEKT